MDRWTDGWTDVWTDQTDRQPERQTDSDFIEACLNNVEHAKYKSPLLIRRDSQQTFKL